MSLTAYLSGYKMHPNDWMLGHALAPEDVARGGTSWNV
jgi:hypothetical protein